MDIGFAPNYTHLYECDITPDADTPTWARIGRGISTIEPNGNEEIDQTAYYDGDGGSSSDVTGGQMILSISGHRVYGDPFQDFVSALTFVYGESRKTRVRTTNPDGEVITAKATVANIVAMGANGDANAKGDFSCELHYDGSPTIEDNAGTVLPESVSVTGTTSVAKGKTAAITPTVTPTNASQRCVYMIEDESIATVSVDGIITGVAAGKVNIAVKCAAKPSVQTVVAVTVTAS